MKTTQYILLWIAAFASIHSLYARADKSMLGEKLPDLKLEYLAGQPDTAGKPMIVEFWATWCPPCRASIPHLNAIHASYKDRGLVVIGGHEREEGRGHKVPEKDSHGLPHGV